jgi:hypothetical protein
MIETNPKQLVGQSITLAGLAENAHQGALVTLSDGCEVYIVGLRRWDKAVLGKRVSVTGRLQRDKLAPDPEVNAQGEVSHGMFGSSLILEEATWELA